VESPNETSDDYVPMRVAIIDVAAEMPTLSRVNPGGKAYGGAWILVLENGVPLRVVEYPFTDEEFDGDALREFLVGSEEVHAPSSPLPHLDDQQLPFISVVVPSTFGRFDRIEQLAQRLSTLDYPSYEAIFVDNRPNRPRANLEREKISQFPRVRVVTEALRGTSAARNRGILESTGEIVAFTDDDAMPHEAWLRSIGTRFVCEPEATCVTGLVIPLELDTAAQVWFDKSGCGPAVNLQRFSSRLAAHEVTSSLARSRFRVRQVQGERSFEHWIYELGSYGMGNNYSFRRDYLEKTGGFPLSLGVGTPSRGGEDVVMLIEHMFRGKTLAYEPSAIVSHANRLAYEDLQEQMFNYGLGVTAALTALAVKDPRHLIGYIRILAPALQMVRGSDPATKHGGRPSDFPKDLKRREWLGLLAGPLFYAQSSWKYRGKKVASHGV
jgi:glycosyltransferase involved in cell wall biosynthesis